MEHTATIGQGEIEAHLKAFLTIAEVAAALSLSEQMIGKLVAGKKIPALRFGRSVRIPITWLRSKVEEVTA